MHWSKNPETRKKVVARLKKLDLSYLRTPEIRKKAGDSLKETLKTKPEILNKWRRHGEKNNFWKGGRYTSQHGYIYMRALDHPNKNARGYVFEHRLVVEQNIGRLLEKDEIVHHINGQKNDNRIENLEVTTKGENARIGNPKIKILQKRIIELEKQLAIK